MQGASACLYFYNMKTHVDAIIQPPDPELEVILEYIFYLISLLGVLKLAILTSVLQFLRKQSLLLH